jgi:hypothetical protein
MTKAPFFAIAVLCGAVLLAIASGCQQEQSGQGHDAAGAPRGKAGTASTAVEPVSAQRPAHSHAASSTENSSSGVDGSPASSPSEDLKDGPALGNPAGDPLSAVPDTGRTPLIRNVAAPIGGHDAKKPKAKQEYPPIFADWPKPKLAIVISGQQNGYLEPCGCAGMENMKGGLMRRHEFLKGLTAKEGRDWPAVIAIDLGNQVRRLGWQAIQQYEASGQALKLMQYDAIGYGPDDLQLGVDPLVLAAEDNKGRIVCANVALFDFDTGPVAQYRVIERGGYKIGVTSIVGGKYCGLLTDDLIVKKDAKQALNDVVPKLKAEGCNFLILLSHATEKESKELAEQFKQFDVVVTAGGADEPPFEPETIEGTKNWFMETGKKGMYVNVIGLCDAAKDRDAKDRRFQRVPMDARFNDSPEIKKVLVNLQERYKQQFLQVGWAGLGIKPLVHPSGRQFVGSETCGECHTKAFAIWKETGHAHAMDTLVKLDVPRQFDAECISCHATGWEPQKFFPYKTGYDSLTKTPHLAHNGCENCHGPGSEHVAIESGDKPATAAKRREAREQMRVTLARAKKETCAACHDLDNSPEYIKQGFDAYWRKVEHKGKD